MKLTRLSVLTLTLCSILGACSSDKVKTDAAIDHVTIGMDHSTVLKMLGPPDGRYGKVEGECVSYKPGPQGDTPFAVYFDEHQRVSGFEHAGCNPARLQQRQPD